MDVPIETRLEKVSEYYILTRNVVITGIFSQKSPGDILNNKTLGTGFEVTIYKKALKTRLRVNQGQWLFSVFRAVSGITCHGL